MADLAINQAGHSDNPLGVTGAMMAVGLVQGFIATHSANGMFNLNPATRKGGVESHIFSRTRLTSGFTTGGGPQAGRMERLNSDISQVSDGPHPWRQLFQQTGLLE